MLSTSQQWLLCSLLQGAAGVAGHGGPAPGAGAGAQAVLLPLLRHQLRSKGIYVRLLCCGMEELFTCRGGRAQAFR